MITMYASGENTILTRELPHVLVRLGDETIFRVS